MVNNQRMFSRFINTIFSSLSSVPFDTLVIIIWGSFAGIFLLAFLTGLALPKIGAASKRPFLCLVNAYSAVTLAAFLTVEGLPQSVLAAALFWCAGYLLYGLLCAVTRPVAVRESTASQTAVSSLPQVQSYRLPQSENAVVPRAETPVAKTGVRLEHAISVTDKLLSKNLGKTDRQELEKLKNTLAVLRMKGTLSPAESEILNDNFNALLKLMAKYNV